MAALYERDGDHFVPTDLTRGPWDPSAQHGGPPAGLATRALERLFGDEMMMTRGTFELIRPVPLEPLAVFAEISRPGRKVQLAEATLVHVASGTTVLRARALAVRRAEVPLPEVLPMADEQTPVAPGPETTALAFDVAWPAFHSHGVETVRVEGSPDGGPTAVWIRLRHPLIRGEEPTGAQRAVIAADFGNGVSQVLPVDRYLFINPDLTVHLLRPPVGEHICLRAATFPGPLGAGMAESALFDLHGRVGRSCQSLLIEPR